MVGGLREGRGSHCGGWGEGGEGESLWWMSVDEE